MYAGRIGYGGQLPYSLGERVPGVTQNLAGVSEAGYGPYLGNFFDDLQKIASKVGLISGKVSDVVAGRSTVATIPTGQATLTLPVGNTGMSQAIPLWVLGVGAAGLVYLAFRPGRRR